MKINATRTISDITSGMIIRQIVAYCEGNYDLIRSYPATGDEKVKTQKDVIVDAINAWLRSQKHITANGLTILNNTISWQSCVISVWESIKLSIQNKTITIPGE